MSANQPLKTINSCSDRVVQLSITPCCRTVRLEVFIENCKGKLQLLQVAVLGLSEWEDLVKTDISTLINTPPTTPSPEQIPVVSTSGWDPSINEDALHGFPDENKIDEN